MTVEYKCTREPFRETTRRHEGRLMRRSGFMSMGAVVMLFCALACILSTGCETETDETGISWTETTFAGMSNAEKIGQHFCLRIDPINYFLLPEYKRSINRLISTYQPGAVFFIADVDTVNLEIQYEFNGDKLLNEVEQMQYLSRTPMAVAAPFESGAWLWDENATRFPSPLALGAARQPNLAYRQGKITAVEAKAQGFSWILGPVVSHSRTDDNIALQMQSFGDDTSATGELARQFVVGSQETGIAACFRYFPNEQPNSCLTLDPASIDGSVDRVADAVQSGVASIMASPLDLADESIPGLIDSSVSAINGMLRERLGFTGPVVYDLTLSADPSQSYSEAEIIAGLIRTGPAMFILPETTDDRIPVLDILIEQATTGGIDLVAVDSSISGLLQFKQQVGLDNLATEEPLAAMAGIGLPEYHQTSRDISDSSITLLRNEDGLIPVDFERENVFVVSFLDDYSPYYATIFEEKLELVSQDIHKINVFGSPDSRIEREIVRRSQACDIAICSFFIKQEVLDSDPEYAEQLLSLAEKVTDNCDRVVVVSYYIPTLINILPAIDGYLIPYAPAEHSIDTVIDVLFGSHNTLGRLPIAISDKYPMGYGLSVNEE
jgi:beta-N-acetylhexosaminidase